ncbi:single-strand DNA-binding protein [Catenulispora sp. GP43]|uniref:single-stranded DNA-binding protein n=1 Tax=Catenulispora sp. GP43 TaxID=3156263 RepID=UPI003512EFF1
MSIGDTTLTVVGNITKDPDLKFLPSGVAVVSFTIAASRRVFDRDKNEWRDGDTLFMRCSAWRHLAEHIGDTLTKGTRVIASGRLSQRDWEDNNGVQRTVVELNVEEIGPSLKYATATVKKAARAGAPHPAEAYAGASAGAGNTGGWGGGEWGSASSKPGPWDGADAPYTGDEPPF